MFCLLVTLLCCVCLFFSKCIYNLFLKILGIVNIYVVNIHKFILILKKIAIWNFKEWYHDLIYSLRLEI
jgi:hypothetical protein